MAMCGREKEQVDAGESHATFVHYLIISQWTRLSSMMDCSRKGFFAWPMSRRSP
jgi:hypothetical protein